MLRHLPRLALVLGALAIAAACGKKGPPLAPIVRIPAGIDKLRAERLGNDVYVTLTLPAANVDGSVPVDISRVEIYGYTGHNPPPPGRFVEAGELVATIPVMAPPPVGAAAAPPPSAPVAAPPVSDAALAGSNVTVIDTLTAGELVQGRIVPPTEVGSARRPPTPPVTPAVTPGTPLQRYYLAVPFSSRARPGPQLTPVSMALFDPPPPPEAFAVSVGAEAATITWQPAGGIVGFLLARALPEEPPPADDAFGPARAPVPGAAAIARPSGPLKYNVYRLPPRPAPSAGSAVPPPVRSQPKPSPRNAMPLAVAAFTDMVQFGIEQCYVVRAVQGTAPVAIEGEPSKPFCFTPADRFAPMAPAGLVAVAAEGAISLIWEPAGEPDLLGYTVLRGAPGDATLQPLTPMPITEARFVDSTARAGTRYVYAVVAVDKAMNVSMESNRAEETAM
jgi:hypothetical protein